MAQNVQAPDRCSQIGHANTVEHLAPPGWFVLYKNQLLVSLLTSSAGTIYFGSVHEIADLHGTLT